MEIQIFLYNITYLDSQNNISHKLIFRLPLDEDLQS